MLSAGSFVHPWGKTMNGVQPYLLLLSVAGHVVLLAAKLASARKQQLQAIVGSLLPPHCQSPGLPQVLHLNLNLIVALSGMLLRALSRASSSTSQ